MPAAYHDEGWWLYENDPGVRGIDQFLAHPDQLGRAVGNAMVSAFVNSACWPIRPISAAHPRNVGGQFEHPDGTNGQGDTEVYPRVTLT